MPHRLRKTRKYRGSRVCGYGRVGQHRKSGVKGRRKPGRHKHLWTYVIKYEPDYFGKRGFKSVKQKLLGEPRIINVGDLEDLAKKLEADGRLERRDGIPYLDLKALGFDKLLGLGDVSQPLLVMVPACSESARRKIEEAGGKILGLPEAHEEPVAEE